LLEKHTSLCYKTQKQFITEGNMLAELGTELLIILALTLANGFFSGSEIAIVSARRGRLEARAKTGSRRAQQAIQLQENPDRFLATVQVGITLIGTFSAAFGGARIGDILTIWFKGIPALQPYAETLALATVVAFITYISLILGELVPKRLALQSAESLALIAAPIMTTLSRFSRPLIALLTVSVNLVVRLLGQGKVEESPVTEEDIVYMVREGTQSGTVEHGEAQMIQRVFQFTDRPIRSVMTPRTEMVAVDAGTPLRQIAEKFLSSGYSRLPVYEETIDHIIGVLHAKDILRCFTEESCSVRDLLLPITVVLETDHIDDVMSRFLRKGAHLAVVIDEYGQTAGIVTLEDLLEELVGDIRDEYDQSEQSAYVQREDGSWLIDGLEAYDRVQARVGLPPIPADEIGDYSSLAGMMMTRLNRIPVVGDKLEIEGFVLEVVDMDGLRIDKVLVRPLAESA
jgi:putative hemolysin